MTERRDKLSPDVSPPARRPLFAFDQQLVTALCLCTVKMSKSEAIVIVGSGVFGLSSELSAFFQRVLSSN